MCSSGVILNIFYVAALLLLILFLMFSSGQSDLYLFLEGLFVMLLTILVSGINKRLIL